MSGDVVPFPPEIIALLKKREWARDFAETYYEEITAGGVYAIRPDWVAQNFFDTDILN